MNDKLTIDSCETVAEKCEEKRVNKMWVVLNDWIKITTEWTDWSKLLSFYHLYIHKQTNPIGCNTSSSLPNMPLILIEMDGSFKLTN